MSCSSREVAARGSEICGQSAEVLDYLAWLFATWPDENAQDTEAAVEQQLAEVLEAVEVLLAARRGQLDPLPARFVGDDLDPLVVGLVAMIATLATSVESPLVFTNSAQATSTEAPPPKPLNKATSCGIAVISILIARVVPIAVPIGTPKTIHQ